MASSSRGPSPGLLSVIRLVAPVCSVHKLILDILQKKILSLGPSPPAFQQILTACLPGANRFKKFSVPCVVTNHFIGMTVLFL